MAFNFPEAWEQRVRYRLTSADKAPWLDGIEELDVPVNTVDPGAASEKNTIHVPATTFDPEVLINNTTYPLSIQEYDDETIDINLDKYTPRPVSVSDDQVTGASYGKIDAATNRTVTAILKKKYGKAAHAIAPSSDSTDTPIIVTTGETINGRKRMTYADLVSLSDAMNAIDSDPETRRLVLCNEHWNDLLLDRDRFGNLLIDYQAGKPMPVIAGFQLSKYINNPVFDPSALTKVPYGAVVPEGAQKGSFVFNTENIAKKTGITKQYYRPSELDPENQKNVLGYRHYFIAMPVLSTYFGAIVSNNA